MRSRLLKSTAILFLSMIFFLPESIAQINKNDFSLTPFARISSYNWKEFDDNGKQLLEESGMLFAFGTKAEFFFLRKKELLVETDLMTYFNKVNYDGFLQDNQGNQTPYKSKTVYFGLQFGANAGWIFPLDKNFFVTPLLGFELEYWNRDIDDGGRFGYDEKYTIFLFQVAGRTKYAIAKNFNLTSNLSFKFPLSIAENIDLASRGQGGPSDINLSPKSNPRILIEAGAEYMNAAVSIFFETWTLGKSAQDQGFLQPESTRKMFGVKLAYSFGFKF